MILQSSWIGNASTTGLLTDWVRYYQPGGGGGTTPQPAVVAGFNTLIINDNFQSTATDGAGHNFNNNSTWLDCLDGSPAPANPLYWEAWVGFSAQDGPCSAIGQATDPQNGQLAMRIHWQDDYYNRAGGGPGQGHGTDIQTTDNSGNGRLTPRGFYLEVVARTDFHTGGNPWMELWSYPNINGTNLAYEIDGAEEVNVGVTCNIHNSNGFDSACGPTFSVDVTQYHTHAWRQTSAGSDVIFCAWVGNADGTNMVKQGCSSIVPTSQQLAGEPPVHQFGVAASGGSNLGNGATGKNTWIKSVKVWSCAGINSGQLCNSSSNNP